MKHDTFVGIIQDTGLNYLNDKSNEQFFIVSLHAGTCIQCGFIMLDPLELATISEQQAQVRVDLCKKRLTKEAVPTGRDEPSTIGKHMFP